MEETTVDIDPASPSIQQAPLHADKLQTKSF